MLLWLHGAAFSAWIVLFTPQSALVRKRKVSVHRILGWFGAALGTIMVVSGFMVSVVMLRFEITVLHRKNVASFLSVLWCDTIIFGACMALVIYLREQPVRRGLRKADGSIDDKSGKNFQHSEYSDARSNIRRDHNRILILCF